MSHPGLFRPFVYHSKTFLDGGLRCPNPAFIADRERRLIWPDVGEPDLFLSLGTGQNRITILQKLSDRPKDGVPDTIIPPAGQTPKKSSGRWRARRIDDVLDAEVQWADFRAYAVRERSEAKGRRFIRFNPDLDKEPPAHDSKHELEHLQALVRKRLQTAHRMAALRNVAHRLVASSFYLDLQSKATQEKSEQVISGSIACRFEDGSAEMSALGKILQDRRVDGFEPFFLVRPDQDANAATFRVVINNEVIRCMIDKSVFGLPNIYIPLKDEGKATTINLFLSSHDGLEPDGFPISGFPRVLLGEKQVKNPRRPVRSSSEQTLRNGRHLRSPSMDGDSISLNGGSSALSRASSSEDSWQDTQAKMSAYMQKSGTPKMSLADLIAQQQISENGQRNRTNRFWTYIGNNHMAQHPELYSPEELSKFATTTGSPRPTELPTPMDEGRPWSPDSIGAGTYYGPQELEANDKATRELQQQQHYEMAREHARSHPSISSVTAVSPPSRSSSLMSQPRPATSQDGRPRDVVPSTCETEFEEETDTYSTYSAEEVRVAQASPMVQVRNSIDSVLSYYHPRDPQQRG